MRGAGSVAWRRIVFTATLALGMAFVAPASAETWGADELRELADDYVRGRLERHPETGTAMGARDYDARLSPATAVARAEERRWLEGLSAALGRIPRDRLEPPLQLERDLLETRFATDRFSLEAGRPWARDPGAVLRTLGPALAGAAAAGRGDCARLQAVTRRLVAVPERLRTAMVDLASPGRVATARAIEQARSLESLHRTGFGFGPRACRDSRLQGDFAVADSSSVRAVEEYRAFLERDVLPTANEDLPWGQDGLAAWLEVTQRQFRDLGALSQRARAEVAALRAQLSVTAAADSAAAAPAGTVGKPRARKREEPKVPDLRRLAAAEALPDDAARRAWELATSPEALAGDPARLGPVVARDLALLQLGRTRRLVAVLALHAEDLDSAATATWLVTDALAEPEDAAREVSDALVDPSVALAALRTWRLREARDEAMAGLGKQFDAGEFSAIVRAVGPLPAGLIPAAVLQELALRHR